MTQTDMLEIDYSDMEREFEAVLGIDGLLHIKQVVTHVTDVPRLPNDSVSPIHTDKLWLTTANNSESLQDQDYAEKNPEIPEISATSKVELEAKLQTNRITVSNSGNFSEKNANRNFDMMIDKIVNLQYVVKAAILQFLKSGPEPEPKLISSGNLNETSKSVIMKSLIKLIKQDNGNNDNEATESTIINLPIISLLIFSLIILISLIIIIELFVKFC